MAVPETPPSSGSAPALPVGTAWTRAAEGLPPSLLSPAPCAVMGREAFSFISTHVSDHYVLSDQFLDASDVRFKYLY